MVSKDKLDNFRNCWAKFDENVKLSKVRLFNIGYRVYQIDRYARAYVDAW